MPALSHLSALPSSSKTVAYPSRAGDSTLLKISLIHLMTDHPPGPTALLTKFLKLYRNIVVAKRESDSPAPSLWATSVIIYYLSSIIYYFLPLTSYIILLPSAIYHQPSTIRNTADLVVKYSCLFPVLVVSAPLLVIFPQII